MIGRKDLVAAAVAPTPQFLLLALVTFAPSLGWRDICASFAIAAALSYGVMLVLGLPMHLFLRAIKRQSLAIYSVVSLATVLALLALVACLDNSPPPLADDNSPFAGAGFFSGLGILFGLCAAPFVILATWIFWWIAVQDEAERL